MFRYTNNELPFILFGLIGLLVAIQLNIRLRNTQDTEALGKKPLRLSLQNPRVWPFVLVSSFCTAYQLASLIDFCVIYNHFLKFSISKIRGKLLFLCKTILLLEKVSKLKCRIYSMFIMILLLKQWHFL